MPEVSGKKVPEDYSSLNSAGSALSVDLTDEFEREMEKLFDECPEQQILMKMMKHLVLLHYRYFKRRAGRDRCGPYMLLEKYADNGAVSHYELVHRTTGEVLWSEGAFKQGARP